jgi:DedD protein
MSIIHAMDRTLKARLIGASVLVLLVVLVVPELLSGRKSGTAAPTPKSASGQTRTYTIELAAGAPRAAADASSARSPAPLQSPLAADQPARATEQKPPDPLPDSPPHKAPPTASVEPTTAAAGTAPDTASTSARSEPAAPVQGTWSVQVGAFGSADSARKLVTRLEAEGFEAYVSTARREGKTLHRVRVGSEAGRAEAESLAGRLKARGLPVSVVAND